MASWYDKYLTIYGKPFSEVPQDVIDGTRERLARLQSPEPLASIVVIGYNEEKHLQACLWAISEIKCKYPVEIIGVDNDSTDRTAEIYEKSGIPYYTEYQHSCGYARRCGLQHAKGRFYFDVDSDTLYPPYYYEVMLEHLLKPGVSCVSATWSYIPDENHSKLSLKLYEMTRDLFLWIQHFKRPELCVRGMVFAFKTDFARLVKIRTDIRRGEDGSLALSLKAYGKIAFLYNRKARPVTGYGTLNERSLWQAFLNRVKIQMKGISRIFFTKDFYEDSEDNLIKPKLENENPLHK